MDSNLLKLKFVDEKFDYIICLNANLPTNKFFAKFKNIGIIAADGAAQKLLRLSIHPDFIIGDLDSLKLDNYFQSQLQDTEIIKIEDQDTNDFEKILNWCKNQNKYSLLITGLHGGDLEHTLNNWSIVSRYSKDMDLCIYDNHRYGISISQSIEFESFRGEIISIIPQVRAELSSENLKWELHNDSLGIGIREGARNCSQGNTVKIQVHSGSFLMFLNSKEPFKPKFL